MKLVNVSVTVVSLTDTAVTALLTLFAVTLKSPAAGEPVTASLVVKVIVLLPASAACALKVGAPPSITNALLADKDPSSAAAGSVNVAALPAASSIVPLFSTSAPVPV